MLFNIKIIDPPAHRCTTSAKTGPQVEEVCRKMGISEATLYNWTKKFGGMGVTELRRLRQLGDENQQLKRLVTDLSLIKEMLKDVIQKHEAVAYLLDAYRIGLRRGRR